MFRKQSIDGTLYRKAQLIAESIDEENRTVRLSFSSEQPVTRQSFFREPWVEILGHKRTEVNLERMVGAPVLYNHSRERGDRIGVVESVSVRNKRGEAVVRISTRSDVEDVWHDIKTGVLTNISVGYNINERKLTRKGEGAPDEYRVTRWTPAEISFVDIPADHTVGVGREMEAEGLDLRASYPDLPGEGSYYRVNDIVETSEDTKMYRKDSAGNLRDEAGNVVNEDGVILRSAADAPEATTTERIIERTVTKDASPEQITEAQRAGAAAEATRRNEIESLLSEFSERLDADAVTELRNATVAKPEVTVDEARKLLLKKLATSARPVGGDPSIEAGEAAEDKFKRGATLAIETRADMLGDKPEDYGNEFRGYTLFEMARYALELRGISTMSLGKLELVGRAFTTSDFPLILANTANKAMLLGFDEAPETWDIWARTGNLSDFKQASRVNLSSFNDLELVNESGEYKYGSFSENGETIQLATYGKLFALSRQAIINDDLNAFTMIPQKMGRAASRVVGDLAYAALTSNPTLADGIALFHASHNNLNSGGAAAISAASVGAGRTAMALQKDSSDSSHGSNIRPRYLLCPVALEDTAKVLETSETNPAGTNSRVPNPVRGTFSTVAEPRLDADSTTRWYLSAGQQNDTVEVAFLNGQRAPTMENQNGWTIDGTEFKVRIDVAAAPMDYRGLQRNDGS